MPGLKNYRLVRAEGLRAVRYQGVTYPLAELTDDQAALLFGKTHVLEKVEQPARKSRTRKA